MRHLVPRFLEDIGNEDHISTCAATGRDPDGTGSSATNHFGQSAEFGAEQLVVEHQQQLSARIDYAGRQLKPEHVSAAAVAAGNPGGILGQGQSIRS